MGNEELLELGFTALGITVNTEMVGSFIAYLFELKKWNRVYSLTALKTDEDIIIKHFLDSCLYLNVIPQGRLNMADIGSGAGFPGIPIKIVRPELSVSLIEPSRKKATFLRHIIRALGLRDIEVIEKGVEAITGHQFDVAVTRALFSVSRFVSKASPIVKEGGLLVMSKGPKVKEELGRLNVPYELQMLKLPLSDIVRYFVIVRK